MKTLRQIVDERQEAQRLRLINEEFPWLWAIKSQWCISDTKILVRNVTDELKVFLQKTCKNHNSVEVWARYALVDETRDADRHHYTCVSRVRPLGNCLWAERVVDTMRNWHRINIVIVTWSNNVTTVKVYREKKPGQITQILREIFEK